MLKKYIALFKTHWALTFEYRAAVVIWMLYGFIPLISMTVWLSLLGEQGAIAGFTRDDLVSYFLALILVRQATGVWVAWELDRIIRQGELSPRLLRPINPIHYEITAHLAEKCLRVPVTLLCLLPVGLALGGIRYDLSPRSLALALLALALAWLLVFLSNYAIGLLAFWLTQVNAIIDLWHGTRMLLAGSIAPIAMMPDGLALASTYLPIRYTMSFPVEILLGRVRGQELYLGMGIALFWAAALWLLIQLLWRRGLRRYGAVGA